MTTTLYAADGHSRPLLTLTFPRLDSGSGAGMTNTLCSAGDHGPPWVGVAVGEHTAVVPAMDRRHAREGGYPGVLRGIRPPNTVQLRDRQALDKY